MAHLQSPVEVGRSGGGVFIQNEGTENITALSASNCNYFSVLDNFETLQAINSPSAFKKYRLQGDRFLNNLDAPVPTGSRCHRIKKTSPKTVGPSRFLCSLS